MTLVEIANEIGRISETSKNAAFYGLYDPYFAPLADQPIKMLELGVHAGDSLKVFSTYFPKGEVIGVDIADPKTDFSTYKNAVFELGDQREGDQLRALGERYAPEGWDIVIDDASHYGSWSRLSFNALYPQLKPGGLYIVEDWQSGYWDDWPDGMRYQATTVEVLPGHIPPRLPSHDSGMVGFLKCLMDEVANRPAVNRDSYNLHPRKFDWMHINAAFAVLKKTAEF